MQHSPTQHDHVQGGQVQQGGHIQHAAQQRMLRGYGYVLLLLILLSACMPQAQQERGVGIEQNVLPTLFSVTVPQREGDRLILQGRYLGDGRGGEADESYVILGADVRGNGGIRIKPGDWSPSRITLGRIPQGVGYGHVFVVVDGVRSNGIPANLGTSFPAQLAPDSIDPPEVVETVQEPSISISLEPSELTMAAGESRDFVARVLGTTNSGVTWQAPQGGGILGQGNRVRYIAPETPGNYTLVVTSAADSSLRATARITVEAAAHNVLPTAPLPGQFIQAPIVETPSIVQQNLVQQTQPASEVTIAPGLPTVTMLPMADPTADPAQEVHQPAIPMTAMPDAPEVSSLTPTAIPAPADGQAFIAIEPRRALLFAGESASFEARLAPGVHPQVQWDALGSGAITGTGQRIRYTAPSQAGSYVLAASSTTPQGETVTATAIVVVIVPSGSRPMPPSTATRPASTTTDQAPLPSVASEAGQVQVRSQAAPVAMAAPMAASPLQAVLFPSDSRVEEVCSSFYQEPERNIFDSGHVAFLEGDASSSPNVIVQTPLGNVANACARAALEGAERPEVATLQQRSSDTLLAVAESVPELEDARNIQVRMHAQADGEVIASLQPSLIRSSVAESQNWQAECDNDGCRRVGRNAYVFPSNDDFRAALAEADSVMVSVESVNGRRELLLPASLQ